MQNIEGSDGGKIVLVSNTEMQQANMRGSGNLFFILYMYRLKNVVRYMKIIKMAEKVRSALSLVSHGNFFNTKKKYFFSKVWKVAGKYQK